MKRRNIRLSLIDNNPSYIADISQSPHRENEYDVIIKWDNREEHIRFVSATPIYLHHFTKEKSDE